MSLKLFIFGAAIVAIAQAGLLPAVAPAATITYSAAAAPAVSHISYASPIVSYGGQIATPTITSQSQNIVRSFGNLGQISTYSKTIDTPYSSVQKADVRISNPGLKITATAPAAIGVAYSAAPAVSHVTYTGLGVNYGW